MYPATLLRALRVSLAVGTSAGAEGWGRRPDIDVGVQCEALRLGFLVLAIGDGQPERTGGRVRLASARRPTVSPSL